MSQSHITLSEPLMEALTELASCLRKTPDESAELALSFFLQSDTANNAIIAKERYDENVELIPISIDQEEEELEYDLRFHPEALEEYESLDEEQQTLAVCALVSRLFDDEDNADNDEDDNAEAEDDCPELVLNETPTSQLILTHFPFGDLVYEVTEEAVSIFMVNFLEEEYEDEDEDEEEMDLDFDEDSIEAVLESDLEENN